MASIVKIKRSNVAGNTPTTSNIVEGELALNTADHKLYSRGGGTVFEVGANVSSFSIDGVEVVDPSRNIYGNEYRIGTSVVINSSGEWVGSDQGIKGQKGEVGQKGQTGAKGQTGSKGQKGEIGAKGTTGSKGITGDKGSTGSKGQ